MEIASLPSVTPTPVARLRRWDERLIIPSTPGFPSTSGLADAPVQPVDGLTLGRRVYTSSDMLQRFVSGGSDVFVVVVDGRRYLSMQPVPGVGNTIRVFLAGTGNGANVSGYISIPNQRTAPPTLNPVNADPDLAFFQELTIRKAAPGDTPGCGFCFGFTSASSGTGQSVYNLGTTPTLGLIGDGAGGFRFGSVNAPSGGPPRGRAYADVNAVQPAALVAPGTLEFTVGLKHIPPVRAGQPARVLCYLNRTLVATLSDAANYLLGENGNNQRDGQGIYPCVLHDADAAASPRMLFRRWWSFWTSDLSDAHPGEP